MENSEQEKNILESQFGYNSFFNLSPKAGWLLNYNIVRNDRSELFVDAYFVDDLSKNFKIQLKYYPTFLVEAQEDRGEIEEYYFKKYEGKIHKVEDVYRIDADEFNHLNKPPKKFLKFFIKTENDFIMITRESSIVKREEEDIYSEYYGEETRNDGIYKIYEHDIPIDVQVGNTYNLRCGLWYDISYTGSEYNIVKNERITYPNLRIMAFDIETTKPPLKFPNAETDEIMMISIMTESFGELIVNRQIVSSDIQEFEYIAKDDMRSIFQISNEKGEEELIIRFIEIIQKHSPHIITTYNGGFFDWPFVEKRASKYNISIENTISIQATREYYESPFLMHLDCYKWVKRDSYLPMNNQGLKAATRVKLGYYPDEIDPEDMVKFAVEDPQKLASYSVSDAVATYYLYIKYVHPHIFSVSSIIPLPIVQILCKGSGTLCEALLFSEAINYSLLVPRKKKLGGLEYYNGHIVENLTYIGGYVESLRAGVYRSDFNHHFEVEDAMIDLIIDNVDEILTECINDPEYSKFKVTLISKLNGVRGNYDSTGSIYHLDVGAMYPNIILTNRLQPISVVNEDICMHCDFNKPENNCKRKLPWVSRAEFLPPSGNEINMIKNQLERESFYCWEEKEKVVVEDDVSDDGDERDYETKGRYKPENKKKSMVNYSMPMRDYKDMTYNTNEPDKVPYNELPLHRRESILKARVTEYSKTIYKRVKKVETKLEELTICQREVPFYAETVRKFRDQRNVVKGHYKKAMKDYDENKCEENKKRIVVYNSLQVAYKCVLNSFYGYVMRTGSRWFSLQMAASVCHIGGQVIKLARDLVERIGFALELDTDGIWCIVPSGFPSTVQVGNHRIHFLSNILNYFVCKKFTNDQYQTKVNKNSIVDDIDNKNDNKNSNDNNNSNDEYITTSQNSIAFELDGPYKTMVIPSSTEENRLLKKRYVVFDENEKITELKGFELKRRGELNFIKKFQEDIFIRFNHGKNLKECYDSLAECCNYWLDIIDTEGGSLDDASIFELFSEARNMSKSAGGYGERKSNILNTARKLAQFLGDDILEDKLKCEFIVSKFPEDSPTADRCIPVLIFRHPEKAKFLRQWLKNNITDLRQIIDWNYYRKRFEAILQRMIVIPAFFQKIENPVKRIEVPRWAANSNQSKLGFTKTTNDIEEIGTKVDLKKVFYNKCTSNISNTNNNDDLEFNTDIIVYNIENNMDNVEDMGNSKDSSFNNKVGNPFNNNVDNTFDNNVANPFNNNVVNPFNNDVDNPFNNKFNCDLHSINFNNLKYLINHLKNSWISFYTNKHTPASISIINSGKYLIKYLNGSSETKIFNRKIYLEINEDAHFEKYQKLKMFSPNSIVEKTFTVMEIPDSELFSEKYSKFFNHFSIKHTYNINMNPIFQLAMIHEPMKTVVDYAIITSFIFNKRLFFVITTDKINFITSKKYSGDPFNIEIASLEEYKKKYMYKYKMIIINSADSNAKNISSTFSSCNIISLDLVPNIFLGSISVLIDIQRNLHSDMKFKFNQLINISNTYKTPIMNIDENILDMILYKELFNARILTEFNDKFTQNIIQDEMYRSGFYGSYCIQFECVNSLLLSIIEYNTFTDDRSILESLKRPDFIIIRELIRNMLISSLKNNTGSFYLVQKAAIWLKKDSVLITPELRELICILHQKYLINLVAKLKELQINVLCASKEIIIIETGKNDLDGCNLYSEYIQNKIASVPGYEILNLQVLRKFEKLAFVDMSNYFYFENNQFYAFQIFAYLKNFQIYTLVILRLKMNKFMK